MLIHLTEWADYRLLDPVALYKVAANPVLIDGRNALDHDQWRAAGWTVHALGRTEPGAIEAVQFLPAPASGPAGIDPALLTSAADLNDNEDIEENVA